MAGKYADRLKAELQTRQLQGVGRRNVRLPEKNSVLAVQPVSLRSSSLCKTVRAALQTIPNLNKEP